MDSRILKLRKKLTAKLNPSRYEHSLSVSFTCACLAMRYEYPMDKAELAGLMHDCAKGYTDKEILNFCEKHKIPVTEAERTAPAVLHAKYGACHRLPHHREKRNADSGQDLICGRLH